MPPPIFAPFNPRALWTVTWSTPMAESSGSPESICSMFKVKKFGSYIMGPRIE